MTPDEHARYAETLLESDRREGGRSSVRQIVLLRAVVHALLALRDKPARKKPGPKPKPKRDTKENEA